MEKTENGKNFAEELRIAAARHLPKELGTLDALRNLLQQLVQVIPPLSVCVSKAERDYWPKVEKEELDADKAAALCAADVNHILRITVVANLNLEGQSEEELLKTWAVLDYYITKLEENQGASLRDLQDRLSGLLQEKKETRRKVEELAAMISAMEQLEEEEKTTSEEASRSAGADQDGQGRKSRKKLALLLIPAAAAILLAVLMPVFSKVSQVEKAIESIGVVSLASGEAIAAAEEQYSALEEDQQTKVENYGVLTEARAVYDCLVAEDAIESIGSVTMESQTAIEHAEELYDALSGEQKKQVGNHATLDAARKEYNRLAAAVEKTVKAINAIGTVGLDSGDKIKAAREAFDALAKDDLQSYVEEEAKILIVAEATFAHSFTQDLYGKAMEFYKAGKHAEALEYFAAIIQGYPNTNAAKDSRKPAQDCRLTLAEKACNRGDQYTAMKIMGEMDSFYAQTEDVKTLREKILNKLEQSRPKSGYKFADKTGWGWCELTVVAGDTDVCVKVVSAEDTANYLMVYVRTGETAELGLKDGNYHVYFTTGDYWYSKDLGFGDEAVYQSINGQLSLASWKFGSVVYYNQYELNLKNTSESDFTTHDSTADEFWK